MKWSYFPPINVCNERDIKVQTTPQVLYKEQEEGFRIPTLQLVPLTNCATVAFTASKLRASNNADRTRHG
ncbi:hypothetical protein HW132_21445 [Brasilonema sp. CT11]|nr:hypothetical protein [Brasilonema sp. CT11]